MQNVTFLSNPYNNNNETHMEEKVDLYKAMRTYEGIMI